jgi:hypothetical protein
MNTFNRKASFLAALLALGLFGTLSASAADTSAATATSASCRHKKTRRVAVWPVGGNPKLQSIPRFETRTLTVCDHEKTLSKPARPAAAVVG